MDDSRVVCDVCHRQVAKYTCPKCNLPYCSLSCFRSQLHAQCSEAFYKREVETDISLAPKSDTERRDMLQLLKRFEETNAQEDGTDAHDEDELVGRVAGLDLEAADPDALWDALNEDERKRFLALLRDADGVAARHLLEDETNVSPWWATGDSDDGDDSTPKPLHVELGLIDKAQAAKGPPLLYNIFALCIVYAHLVRTYALISLSNSVPELHTTILQTLSELAPYLLERRSTAVFASVEEAVAFLWSRTPSLTGQHMAQLLEDAKRLLMPVPVSAADVVPQHRTLRVLYDVREFVASSATPKALAHVGPKLSFYGAHVLAQPLQVLSLLRAELESQLAAVSETKDAR